MFSGSGEGTVSVTVVDAAGVVQGPKVFSLDVSRPPLFRTR